jgi:hypothetical protein
MTPTAWWGRMTPKREAQFREMVDDRGRHNYDIGHYWNAVEELLDVIDDLRGTLKATEKDLREERITNDGLTVEINWYRTFLNPPMRERVGKIAPDQFNRPTPEDK